MHDVHEPLNLAEDSIAGAERLVAGAQTGVACSFRAEGPGGAAGTAAVQPDGSFSFKTHEGRRTQRNLCACFGRRTDDTAISGGDVIGAQLEATDSFRVWYCPLRSASSRKKRRKLCKTGVLRCRSSTEAHALVQALRSRAARSSHQERQRRIVIVLNPVSGRGCARKQYERKVRGALDAAGLQHDLHVTQRPCHATEILAGLDLQGVSAVVFMGGDGTVHEGLQGLLGRPDWQAAAQVPIALLPAGSGNALSANTGMWDLPTALHAVIKGKQSPIDIVSILQPPHPRRYAFLSVTFGMFANLDIGTENLRWMGDTRFTVGALQQILWRRCYSLRLAYLPASQSADANQQAHQSAQPTDSGGLQGDGSSAQHRDASGAAPPNGKDAEATGPPTPLLDDLFREGTAWSEGRLPEGWQQHRGDEVQMFTACNLQYLDLTYNIAPRAGLHTGCMDLLTTPQATRMQGLEFMMKSENGNHIDLPILDYRQVSALAVEPISSGTWLVVDGEKVPYTRLYAQVHAGLCNVLVAA